MRHPILGMDGYGLRVRPDGEIGYWRGARDLCDRLSIRDPHTDSRVLARRDDTLPFGAQLDARDITRVRQERALHAGSVAIEPRFDVLDHYFFLAGRAAAEMRNGIDEREQRPRRVDHRVLDMAVQLAVCDHAREWFVSHFDGCRHERRRQHDHTLAGGVDRQWLPP